MIRGGGMDSGIPSPPTVQASQDLRGLHLTLAAYIAIFAAKLAAYFAEAVHAGLRIEVQPSLPVEEVARIAHEVHRRVHSSTIHSGYCFVQIDAAKRSPAPAADSGRA